MNIWNENKFWRAQFNLFLNLKRDSVTQKDVGPATQLVLNIGSTV